MSVKKRALQIAVFLVIMFLTFYALFSGRDLSEIGRALQRMSPWYLIPSVGLAVRPSDWPFSLSVRKAL